MWLLLVAEKLRGERKKRNLWCINMYLETIQSGGVDLTSGSLETMSSCPLLQVIGTGFSPRALEDSPGSVAVAVAVVPLSTTNLTPAISYVTCRWSLKRVTGPSRYHAYDRGRGED